MGAFSMHIPAKVGQAIRYDEHQIPFGEYSDFILRSAYQPIYKIASNTTVELHGFEGLIRVYLGGRLIDTKSFLDSVIPEHKLHVEMMCNALHVSSYKCSKTIGKTLFLNINAENFPSSEVAESEMYYLFSQLRGNGLDKGKVVFELHNGAVAGPYVLTKLCEMFRGNGFEFALDDFGVEHSSIERYILLRPNIIKINRGLFIDSERFRRVESLMGSLVMSFRDNGACVLMDCIETDYQLAAALQMEVTLLQGYYLGRPQLHPVQCNHELVVPNALKMPSLSVISA